MPYYKLELEYLLKSRGSARRSSSWRVLKGRVRDQELGVRAQRRLAALAAVGARISNVIGYTVKVLSIEFDVSNFSTFGRLQHAGTKQPPTNPTSSCRPRRRRARGGMIRWRVKPAIAEEHQTLAEMETDKPWLKFLRRGRRDQGGERQRGDIVKLGRFWWTYDIGAAAKLDQNPSRGQGRDSDRRRGSRGQECQREAASSKVARESDSSARPKTLAPFSGPWAARSRFRAIRCRAPEENMARLTRKTLALRVAAASPGFGSTSIACRTAAAGGHRHRRAEFIETVPAFRAGRQGTATATNG